MFQFIIYRCYMELWMGYHYIFVPSLPWNQDTIIGYISEICVVIASGQCYLIINGAAIVLFVSICRHHEAFYKMIKHDIQEMDSAKGDANHILLRRLITFHISVKE